MVAYYEEEKARIQNSKTKMTLPPSLSRYQTNESKQLSQLKPYEDSEHKKSAFLSKQLNKGQSYFN